MTQRGPKITCTCGTCTKCKGREAARRWRENHREDARAASARWRAEHPAEWQEIQRKAREKRRSEGKATPPEKRKEYNERYRQNLINAGLLIPLDEGDGVPFEIKKRAREMVAYAVRKGVLTKQPCVVCGSTYRIHGHHDDYEKPLDVVWFCARHHNERHLEIRKERQVIDEVRRGGETAQAAVQGDPSLQPS